MHLYFKRCLFPIISENRKYGNYGGWGKCMSSKGDYMQYRVSECLLSVCLIIKKKF